MKPEWRDDYATELTAPSGYRSLVVQRFGVLACYRCRVENDHGSPLHVTASYTIDSEALGAAEDWIFNRMPGSGNKYRLTNVGELLTHSGSPVELFERLEAELLALPLETPCGQDCMLVIVSAAATLALMPDVDEYVGRDLWEAVGQQCRVLYFG